MDVAITKMSSKGQIVIPSEMRKGIHVGEKLVIIQSKDQLIMKRVSKLKKSLVEELEFARRTEEAWKSYDRGEFKSMGVKDFLKKLEKW